MAAEAQGKAASLSAIFTENLSSATVSQPRGRFQPDVPLAADELRRRNADAISAAGGSGSGGAPATPGGSLADDVEARRVDEQLGLYTTMLSEGVFRSFLSFDDCHWPLGPEQQR